MLQELSNQGTRQGTISPCGTATSGLNPLYNLRFYIVMHRPAPLVALGAAPWHHAWQRPGTWAAAPIVHSRLNREGIIETGAPTVKPHHAAIVDRLPPAIAEEMLRDLSPRGVRPRLKQRRIANYHLTTSERVARLQLYQSDCVLSLLRLGHRRWVEKLIGHKIRKCPPCLRPSGPPIDEPDNDSPDQRTISWIIGRNPKTTWASKARFALLRVGMTVEQYRSRGGRRRDLRGYLKKGWIRMNDPLNPTRRRQKSKELRT